MIFTVPVSFLSDSCKVYFLHCSDEEAEKWKRKTFTKDTRCNFELNHESQAFCTTNNFICIIRFYEDPIARPDIVVHEIFHAVYHLSKHTGITLTPESEEFFAYAIGFITREFYKKAGKYVD